MARARTASTTSTLTVDGIPVIITRKQVRNINLRVKRDGTVAVSAPPRVSQDRIADFVRARRAWIAAAQERIKASSGILEAQCAEGAEVMLWGTPLTCRLIATPASGRWPRSHFSVEGDTLVARVDERLMSTSDEQTAKRTEQLEAWLKGQLEDGMRALAPSCEQTVGRHASLWRLKHMHSRWGSCNVQTGTISLSTTLVHYPQRCLRYVMIHELCHLHEPSHNARFHALMDHFCPTWRADRATLNGR